MVRPTLLLLSGVALLAGCASPVQEVVVPSLGKPGGAIVMQTAAGQNEDPFEAGRTAAQALRDRAPALDVVLVAECFDEESLKRRVLEGAASVLPRAALFGGATYGSFAQSGCLDANSVGLLAIGGEGIGVAAALQRDLGVAGLTLEEHEAEIASRLRAAGEQLARKLPRSPDDRLLILIADAHSPKNRYLVEGAQEVFGRQFPITGGSVNKNAGQTFVYFQGRMYQDSAVALLLSGDFRVALAGRQAKENAKVIATAKEAAAEAGRQLQGKPFAALAFDCAGRKGKLQRLEDELAAMQQALGSDLPLFGCYCAGEIGPADLAEKRPGVLSSGVGWHVMVTLLGR